MLFLNFPFDAQVVLSFELTFIIALKNFMLVEDTFLCIVVLASMQNAKIWLDWEAYIR